MTKLVGTYSIRNLALKRNCTECDKKITDGRSVAVHLNAKGKVKAYLCSDECMKVYDSKIGVRNE